MSCEPRTASWRCWCLALACCTDACHILSQMRVTNTVLTMVASGRMSSGRERNEGAREHNDGVMKGF